jgi:hypothetical protein
MLGVTNAGGFGPIVIPLTPKANSVRRTATAFCSNQETTRVRGSSLTEQPKASARAAATRIAP